MLALALRLGSAFSFATLLALVKYVGQRGVALPEIMFWRQFICVPLLLGWLAMTGNLPTLRTRRIRAHGGRALVGMSNMVLNFGSYILLPLAEATVLGFTTPLFAVLIAALVLRQHVGPWRWTAVLVGLAGVIILARPSGEPIPPLGAAMALTCAFLIAVINYQIRDLGRTESPACTVFWFSLFGSLLTAPLLPFVMKHHSPIEWLMVIGLGVLGLSGQMLMTASLRYAAVSTVVVMDYTALIWATIYGWLVWDKLPPGSTFLGAPLIIAAGVVIAWRQHRLSREVAVSSTEND